MTPDKSPQAALMPCPFCGSQAVRIPDDDFYKTACSNHDCFAMPETIGRTQERADIAWNTRPTPPDKNAGEQATIPSFDDFLKAWEETSFDEFEKFGYPQTAYTIFLGLQRTPPASKPSAETIGAFQHSEEMFCVTGCGKVATRQNAMKQHFCDDHYQDEPYAAKGSSVSEEYYMSPREQSVLREAQRKSTTMVHKADTPDARIGERDGLLNPDMPAEEMRLHMGEMTAQEVRTARAAIRWANTRIIQQPAPVEPVRGDACWFCDGTGKWGWSEAPDLYDCEECQKRTKDE